MFIKGAGWPERIDVLIRVFFYILAFWLPYSPAVVESCIITAVILWFIKRALIKDFRFPASILNGPIYVFLIACALSVLSSVLWQRALGDLITKVLEWFVVFWLIQESFRERRQIIWLIGIFLFSAVAVTADGLLQYHVLGKDIFNSEPISPDGRVTASFNAPAGLGGYLAAAIPLSFGALLVFGRRQKILWLPVIGAMLWTMTLTFVRGAWVGAFTGVLFFWFVYFLLKGHVEIVKTLSIGLIFLVLTVWFPLFLNMESTLKMLNRSNTISWRFSVWEDTLPMIKDRPLFGHGVNTYMPIFQAYRRDPVHYPTYAHNCFLQLAAECGLVGLAAFLWIWGRLYRATWRQLKMMEREWRRLTLGVTAATVGFLVHSFFDTNLYALQLGILLWLLVGIQTKMIQLSSSEETSWRKENAR